MRPEVLAIALVVAGLGCSSAGAPGQSAAVPASVGPAAARDAVEEPAPAVAPGVTPADSAEAPPPAVAVASSRSFRMPVVPRERTLARVLLYHTFALVSPRPGVPLARFRQHLAWLRENDVEVVRMSDLVAFLEGDVELPERVAVITIDDGERNGYTRAFPILREHGAPFTLGIATRAVERHREHGAVDWAQLREMVDSGLCEIASHSHTHRRMTVLPSDQLAFELEHSRDLVERHVGVRPEVFFYPLGANDARVRAATEKAGYRAGFVAWGAPVRATTRRYRIPRYTVEATTSVWQVAAFFSHE